MISPDQIEQVRSAVDIVEVVREYVPSLKASGRTVRGLCPFHSERTPSFHVHPEKKIFKCFGCGESGDVISFLCKMEQVGFTDAVKKLAEQGGVRLQWASGREEKDPPNVREKLYRVLEGARSLYEEHLWNERTGAAARAYLEKRGVQEDTARMFRLGFAPAGLGAAFETLVQKGFSIDLCHQAGLASRSASGRLYDPLFGRLVFPITDSFGHVVGFGGRVLPNLKASIPGLSDAGTKDSGPSYLNSPDSPVFKKGESLYGLTQAKGALMEKKQAIVLEGYMDVIGLHQAGIKNAVATLGTAFTNAHARVLKRYVTEVAAFFDPDEAGRKAAERSLEPLLEEDLFPRIVQAVDESDPDEIVLAKGPAFLENMIATAPDFVDAFLNETASDAMSLQKKAEAAKELLRIIGRSPNEILKSEWLHRISVKLGLQEGALKSELAKTERKPASTAPQVSQSRTPAPVKRKVPPAEDECLMMLMTLPRLWDRSDLDEQDFEGEAQKRLFRILRESPSGVGPTEIQDKLPAEDRGWLIQLSMEEREYGDADDQFGQLARGLRRRRDQKRFDFLKKKLVQEEGTEAEREELKMLLRRVKGSAVETFHS